MESILRTFGFKKVLSKSNRILFYLIILLIRKLYLFYFRQCLPLQIFDILHEFEKMTCQTFRYVFFCDIHTDVDTANFKTEFSSAY